MCDYSLEMYHSRPAMKGERYETIRFPSGSIGFVAPQDHSTAVCMACDTRLELSNIPSELQKTHALSDRALVTFVHIEHGLHHDGVRFANGREINLQQLGTGVAAEVVEDLIDAKSVKEPASDETKSPVRTLAERLLEPAE